MLIKISATFLVVAMVVVSLGFTGVNTKRKANAQDDKANAPMAPGYGQNENVELFPQPTKPKPGRRRPKPRPHMAPPLSMQYWMMIRNRDCQPQEVDPNANFATNDQLRLGAKVNQPGHMYIFLSVEGRDEATMVFPERRINRGSNEVVRNLEIIVPYRCPTAGARDETCPRVNPSTDCWWNMVKPYGRKYITIIFSRDEIIKLENLYRNSETDPRGTADLPRLSVNELDEIKRQTVREEDLRRENIRPDPNQKGFIANNFITRITNLNRRDNEEIFETITLRHQQER
jgi:hypothetical protein